MEVNLKYTEYDAV